MGAAFEGIAGRFYERCENVDIMKGCRSVHVEMSKRIRRNNISISF